MAQFCSQCGSLLPENANVCPQCGKPVNNPTIQAQPQPQQPQQAQPIPQYQQSPYYRQPAENNGGGNKGLLYGIIALLVALLIGGAAWYFISESNEKDALQAQQMEQMKQEQKKLADENKELTEQNEKLAEENAKPAKVIVKKEAEHAAEHRAVSAGGSKAKVVINGEGVRLRFAPSLNAGYLTWENGKTRAPKKGARLEYTGEDGDWYQVKYLNHTFYVSKEFSYLEY